MNDKDKQIRNMMEYITSRPSSDIRKRGEGVFIMSRYLDSKHITRAGDKAIVNVDSRDETVFTVDFITKSIEMYAYDESGHNGDHYNCTTMNVDWSHLSTCYDRMKQVVQQMAAKQIEEEEKAKAGEKRLKEILSGEYHED